VAADLAVESFVRVGEPDLSPELLREDGYGEKVSSGGVEMGARIRQFALKGVKDAVELGVDRVGIGELRYRSAAVSSSMP